MPIDILSAENLVKLDLLCRIVWETLRKLIKIYLVAEDEQRHLQREFYDGKQILSNVLECIPKWSYFKDELIKNIIDEMESCLTLVNVTIEDALLETIRSKPDMILGYLISSYVYEKYSCGESTSYLNNIFSLEYSHR